MVGRKRKTDKHLPNRVYQNHGAYYFVDHNQKWHRLGKSLGEAYRALAHFVDDSNIKTMGDLCDRYVREVLCSYSTKEQKSRAPHLGRIRDVFGHQPPREVTAAHVRAFRDRVGERLGRDWARPQLAFKAMAFLSHVCSWGVEWGVMDSNPCQGVKRPPQPKRKRYPTDQEFAAVYNECPPMQQIAMDLALLTGLRREDILRLTRDSVTSDGLLVETRKTDKPLLFLWSDDLRRVVDKALGERPRVRRHIICNGKGKGYTPDGFSSIWRRARLRAMEKGIESFRFNDIRAKSATDDDDSARASSRLGHTNPAITERFYIRKPKKVYPLR